MCKPARNAADTLQRVRKRIDQACVHSGRPSSGVQLLAVSKMCSPAQVLALVHSGQYAFGENYVQEAITKITETAKQLPPDIPLQWHCLGPIQSNKTRLVASYFDWVQSLDRIKIADRLAQQRPAHLKPLNVCIQVNIDNSPSKAGIAPDAVFSFAKAIDTLPNLRLRGIMLMPDAQPNMAQNLSLFQAAYTLWRDLQKQFPKKVDTLSLGMSADLEAAIAAGSTMVRVGSALFGARPRAA